MNRILIVDDNEENLYYLQVLLNGQGHTVDTARHGAEALTKARQCPPALIVSDLLMPVMDGYTLLRHWKADEHLRHIPFIVYTATYTKPEDERLALSLGADAFVLKPAEPEAFIARMYEVQTRATRPDAPPPKQPIGGEKELLEAYSQTLIRKLGEKMLQLEEINRALRASEETQRSIAETQLAILNALPAHIALVDSEGVIVLVNESWRRFAAANSLHGSEFGAGQNYLKIGDRTGGDCVEEAKAAAAGIRQVLHGESKQFALEYACHSPKEQRWFRLMVAPLREDRRPGAVIMHLDITERKRLEEQFHEAQKMEAIGTLAGGVAHDFNNILGTILGNVSMAKLDLNRDHPSWTSLEEIGKAGQRAKGLVQQILTFSRHQPLERRVISLAPVIEEAVGLLRSTLPAGVELARFVARNVPNIRGDSTQMYQVLLNLCTNAWHALEGNPGRIEIRLEGASLDFPQTVVLGGIRSGDYVCLSVSDTGKGMDESTLKHIFEPFFTTKPVGQGTGLGLASVHGIVHNHDGAIKVVSQPGQGATFYVYFPAVSESLTAPARGELSGTPRGEGQHILYLDDEDGLVYLAKRVLERLGYRVTGFTRPADCLKAFRADPKQFDLVITDFSMPGASGVKVAGEILEVRPEMPVVLSSGYITEDLKETARRIGIRQVIYKPNTVEELGQTIHTLITGPRSVIGQSLRK